MVRVRKTSLCIFAVLIVYSIVSIKVFNNIYDTSELVVDEEFHYPLGEAYCHYEFDKWHPKVTTFPGLYLLSSLLLGWLDLCSHYWLRFVSYLFSIVNILLFYRILNLNNPFTRWKNIVSATNLGLLPPLYFFSNFYYTDVTSLTMVLLLYTMYQSGNHYFASIFGLFAVLFRQTNIVWVGLFAASYVLKELNAILHNKKHFHMGGQEFLHLSNPFNGSMLKATWKTSVHFWLNTLSYASLLIFFLIFVVSNGSIVVGDKSAHEATIHLPQILYFSLFCLFFAWPHFITEIPAFYGSIRRNFLKYLAATLLCLAIVHFNTLVHPYMLADNRHYVFYVWTRFYAKYELFKYAMVPIYIFALYGIVATAYNRRDVTVFVLLVPCTFAVLVSQKLLELRYFFVPYVLWRTQVREVSNAQLTCEFITYIVVNSATLYLFFNKTIGWPDFDYPQRLIW